MDGRRVAALGATLATATLVLTLVADVASASVVFVPFFALAPLIACAALSPRWTVVFAGGAVGLVVVSGSWDETFGTGQYGVRLGQATLVSVAAVLIAVLRTRRERQLVHVRAIADSAQRAVLPSVPEYVGGLRIAARYESASEEALVGGDLYDLHHSGAGVRMVVGDVRGKGLAGVQHAARVIRAFRQSAAATPDLAAVAKAMQEYLVPFFDDEEFVTAVLVEFTWNGVVTVLSCGHPAPLLVRQGAVTSVAVEPSPPLGLATSFVTAVFLWAPEDRLLLYTDGLVEARDRDGTFLPFATIVDALRLPDPQSSLDALLAAVEAHVRHGTQHLPADDIALVLVDNLSVGTVEPA